MKSVVINTDDKWVIFKEKFAELYETAKQRKKDNTKWGLPGNIRLYTDVMHGFWAVQTIVDEIDADKGERVWHHMRPIREGEIERDPERDNERGTDG